MNRRVPFAIAIAFLLSLPAVAPAQQDGPPLNPVGLTGLAWGAWIRPDTKMEDWVQMGKGVCRGEEFCKINVFEGPELATHIDPVPEENRKGLKYVFTYEEGQSPSVTVREVHPEEGKEPREWTFD